MKQWRTRFAFMAGFLVIGAASLVLSSCGGGGGGGGGGGTTTGTTGTKSAGSGAAAVQTAVGSANFGLGSMSGGGFTGKPSFRSLKQAKSGSLKTSLAAFYKGYKAKAMAVSAFTATACTDGGTMDLTSTATGSTITFTNCTTKDATAGTTEVQNGAMNFSATATGFSFSLGNSTTHYTDKVTRDSDSRVVSNTDEDLTVTGTFGLTTPLTCASGTFPSGFSFAIDGTSLNQEDTNIDGVFDINESDSFTSVAFALTVTSVDSATCEPTDFSMSLSGGITLTDNLDSNNNMSLTISAGTPMTFAETAVTTPAAGDNVMVSGSFTCTTKCFSGTLTITTTTPLFIPTGQDCPTSGEISVSGSVTGTVTYSDPATAAGGVAVTVSDSSGTKTYTSCTDVGACT
ncbi:MAG: hypothetical protein HY283_02635 [Nitrospirae bacterium]|nr:hypothetical protein [Nitrospirota bacterium]